MVLDSVKLDNINSVINAINSRTRYRLIRYLKENTDLYIEEISRKTGIYSSVVSSELRILEKNGLIVKENWRDKRFAFYKVNNEKVEKLLKIIEEEDNIFLKSYLLSNNYTSRIISLLSDGSKLQLKDIDRLAKISPTQNSGRCYKLLQQLILANLVKRDGLFYSINGTELVKTIKIFKQL